MCTAYGQSNFVTKQSVGVERRRLNNALAHGTGALCCSLQIRRRRLARLAALSSTSSAPSPATPPVTFGASIPSPDVHSPQPPSRLSPTPSPRGSTEPNTPDVTNREPNFSNTVRSEQSDQSKIPADALIVTEKVNNNLLDEMPDTKMTDLSQTRQYSSFDSMGDDTLLSCGSVRVGSLPQSTVGGSEGASTREDSTSRSISPPQFVEPSPVRPRLTTVSPSCSRRSLSMEVDDVSERNSQSEQQQEAMEVCNLSILLILLQVFRSMKLIALIYIFSKIFEIVKIVASCV